MLSERSQFLLSELSCQITNLQIDVSSQIAACSLVFMQSTRFFGAVVNIRCPSSELGRTIEHTLESVVATEPKLSVEAKFEIAAFASQVEGVSLSQAKDLLKQIHSLLVAKDQVIKNLVKTGNPF